MASPQTDTGYTRIANELFEAIMTRNFTKRQRNILDLIIRMSYGCGKKCALLRPSDYEIVGVLKFHIRQELDLLISKKVIVIEGELTFLNKNYEQWDIANSAKAERLNDLLRRNLTHVTETVTEVTKTVTKVAETVTPPENELPKQQPESYQNSNSEVTKTVTDTPSKSAIIKRFRLPKEILKKYKENKRSSPSPPKGKGRDSPKYKFSPSHMLLAEYLLECIRNNLPDYKEPNLDAWANEMRLLNENDKRDESRIRRLITWCQQDNFWKPNILSPGKLREKFDQLELRMNGQNQNIRGAPHNATGTSRRNIDNDPIPVSKLIIRDTGEQGRIDVSDLPDLS
jgi:hypothetical protein